MPYAINNANGFFGYLLSFVCVRKTVKHRRVGQYPVVKEYGTYLHAMFFLLFLRIYEFSSKNIIRNRDVVTYTIFFNFEIRLHVTLIYEEK